MRKRKPTSRNAGTFLDRFRRQQRTIALLVVLAIIFLFILGYALKPDRRWMGPLYNTQTEETN